MKKEQDILAEEGIRFFGQISASATHEIKNTLSIINENAGLLEDLTLLAQNRGQELSLTRVQGISQGLARQVKRTDRILQRLNRFSHSVDLATQIADLEQTVGFVLDVGSRLIEMLGSKVTITASPSVIMVETNLFYLENIIWRAVETACRIAGPQKGDVTITFEADRTGPLIWFSIEPAMDSIWDDLFASKEEKALMTYLGLSFKKNNTGFGFLWPNP